MKKFSKGFIIGGLLLFLIPVISLGGVMIYLDSHLGSSADKVDLIDLNISNNENLNGITNIALFGTDNRNPNTNSRSDAIIIATLNPKTKKIKLTSIMRDSLLEIQGKGKDKANHAYSYGGPSLALHTLNSNFDLNIQDYISVDFYSLAKIIDILGGLEVTLKPGEAAAMNKAINEINKVEGYPHGTDYVPDSSYPQKLNGRQAVSYARIRKVGDGDFERTERQRRVLNLCFNKLQTISLSDATSLISQVLPLVKTNLTSSKIISLGTKILTSGPYSIEQMRLPVDGTFKDGRFGKMWAVDMDIEANTKALHDFITDSNSYEENSYNDNSNS